jgi:hypothetical protein
MTCGACERVIERVVAQGGARLVSIDATLGEVGIRAAPETIGGIKQELAARGFRERDADEERGDPGRILAYARSVLAGEEHVHVESSLLNYAIGSAAVLSVAGVLSYGTVLGAFGNPFSAASLLLFVIVTGVVSVFAAMHMETYRKGMTCANGMMAGMTTGMVSGYMVGAILGATNGMFVGAVAGTAAGVWIGLGAGRYSGIMGAMEGVMAGLMSGTMGAMTTFMMINDNLLAFMYILSGLCIVMAGMLSYMMFREAGPAPRHGLRGGFIRFLSGAGAISGAMMLIVLYGPRSALVFTG